MDELDKKTIDDLVKGWGHLIQQPEPESISEPKPAPKPERKVKPASLPENHYDDDFSPFDDYVPPRSYSKRKDYSLDLFKEPEKPVEKLVVDPLKEKFNKEADDLISNLQREINSINQCAKIVARKIEENQIDPLKIAQIQIAKKQLTEIQEMSWRQSFQDKKR